MDTTQNFLSVFQDPASPV